MSNKSLIPKSPSHNDITQLAEILEHNFQCYHQQQTLFKSEYIRQLKTVVGLGFLTIMLNNTDVSSHQPYFNQFLDYLNTDVQQVSIAPIAVTAAEIIQTAAGIFCTLKACPDYYNIFAKGLECVVKNPSPESPEKEELSQSLIQKMLRTQLF